MDPLLEVDGPHLEAGEPLLEAYGPDLEAEGLPRLAVITGEEVDQRELAKLRRSDLEDCLRLLVRLLGLKNIHNKNIIYDLDGRNILFSMVLWFDCQLPDG